MSIWLPLAYCLLLVSYHSRCFIPSILIDRYYSLQWKLKRKSMKKNSTLFGKSEFQLIYNLNQSNFCNVPNHNQYKKYLGRN